MGHADERIQSLPLKSVFPLIISAMIQPTDQMSTRINKKQTTKKNSENQSRIQIVLSLVQ